MLHFFSSSSNKQFFISHCILESIRNRSLFFVLRFFCCVKWKSITHHRNRLLSNYAHLFTHHNTFFLLFLSLHKLGKQNSSKNNISNHAELLSSAAIMLRIRVWMNRNWVATNQQYALLMVFFTQKLFSCSSVAWLMHFIRPVCMCLCMSCYNEGCMLTDLVKIFVPIDLIEFLIIFF